MQTLEHGLSAKLLDRKDPKLAEGVGFEPTQGLLLGLISSQPKRPREKGLSLGEAFQYLSTIVNFCAE
jgi:hypothetical protein